jgi:hypothetical protein
MLSYAIVVSQKFWIFVKAFCRKNSLLNQRDIFNLLKINIVEKLQIPLLVGTKEGGRVVAQYLPLSIFGIITSMLRGMDIGTLEYA